MVTAAVTVAASRTRQGSEGAAIVQGNCLNSGSRAPDIGVRPGPEGVRGRVLPGTGLRREIVNGGPGQLTLTHPLAPRYPGGAYPEGPARWNGLAGVPRGRIVRATQATASFNAEGARHRVAHHQSHFGGQMDSAGDFNRDGVEDFMVTEHYSYVDGALSAGEIHLYFGRRGRPLDPRRMVPDIIFYGGQLGGKLGLSITPAGDMNGDGWPDIAMSAGFHNVQSAEGEVKYAGIVYVVFGGYLQRFRCTVKVRLEDIGTKVPGLVLEGGHDGGRYVAWANGLDSGDFDGDGHDDLVIGSYDPYPGVEPTFTPRAYAVYGGRGLPRRGRPFRLGVDGRRGPVRATTFTLPATERTDESLGFGAYAVKDLNGDARDELAFTVAGRLVGSGSTAHLVHGDRRLRKRARVDIRSAQTRITAEPGAQGPDGRLEFGGIGAVRPAGDVNGDGRLDALVTARATRLRDASDDRNVGAVGVLYGSRKLPRRISFGRLGTVLYGTKAGSKGHPAIDRGRDFDRDGYADVLVNDPYHVEPIGGQSQWRGRLWLIRGRRDMPKWIDVERRASLHFVADTRAPGMLGYTWNTGDWNDDGWPDLAVGDHYLGDHALHDHAGVAYIFTNGCSFRLRRAPPASKACGGLRRLR